MKKKIICFALSLGIVFGTPIAALAAENCADDVHLHERCMLAVEDESEIMPYGEPHCDWGRFYVAQRKQIFEKLETTSCTHDRAGYIHVRRKYHDAVIERCGGCGFEVSYNTNPYWVGWSCEKVGM